MLKPKTFGFWSFHRQVQVSWLLEMEAQRINSMQYNIAADSTPLDFSGVRISCMWKSISPRDTPGLSVVFPMWHKKKQTFFSRDTMALCIFVTVMSFCLVAATHLLDFQHDIVVSVALSNPSRRLQCGNKWHWKKLMQTQWKRFKETF